jgi:DNA-binding MarR family transcriptional regulator
LITLANYADVMDGTLFAGQRRIAADTGYNVATVFREMRKLERDNMLICREKQRSTRDGRQTDVTTLLLDVPPINQPENNPKSKRA